MFANKTGNNHLFIIIRKKKEFDKLKDEKLDQKKKKENYAVFLHNDTEERKLIRIES